MATRGERELDRSIEEVIKNLARIDNLMQRPLIDAVEAGAAKIADHAKREHPRWPNTINNRDGTPRYHNVTSNLSNSIYSQLVEAAKDRIVAEAGATVEYAAMIELGTVKIRPHPYLQPAMEANREICLKLVIAAVRRVLK